jgi:hypothetical protein
MPQKNAAAPSSFALWVPMDFGLACLVILLAFLVRLPFVQQGEVTLHSDEGIVGLMAEDIAAGDRYPAYFYGQRYMGALEAYLIAPLVTRIESPVIWLRLGPAMVFAVFAAVQFRMLASWFGRGPALVGAAALLGAAPAFLQWSIAARGGYIEIFLWGSMLWWLYFARFANSSRPANSAKLALGFLLGSGMWINPMILAFAAPVLVHLIAWRGLPALRNHPGCRSGFELLDRAFPRLPLAAPIVLAAVLLAINVVFTVAVRSSGVKYRILLGLFPAAVAIPMVLIGVLLLLRFIWNKFQPLPWIRGLLSASAPAILGLLVGYLPNGLYVATRLARGEELDDSLPMAIRPLWTIAETAEYLWRGLPLLFGADSRSFTDLVLVGRDYQLFPLEADLQRALPLVHALSIFCLLTLVATTAWSQRRPLQSILRLQAAELGPAAFLILAATGFIGLFLISACAFDFTSVRYLVPLWTVVPGLIAAALVQPRRLQLTRLATAILLTCWSVGQLSYFAQLGAAHPLARLAQELTRRGIAFAVAEPYDAHLISYLTRQQVRLAEFLPFWNRLPHFRAGLAAGKPVPYLVHATDWDWTASWNWPGPAPAETRRRLWPQLQAWCATHPDALLSRETLVDGFELWILKTPLPEPDLN